MLYAYPTVHCIALDCIAAPCCCGGGSAMVAATPAPSI
jgi:hypothetical protein